MIAVFWVAVAALVEVYLVFPATVVLRGRLRPRPHREATVTPTVTVVVAARDEEAVIGAKLRTVLASDYPAEALEVIVASDGSRDGTHQVVRSLSPAVTLLTPGRVGKAAALNAAIESASGDVLVFTDANSLFTPTSLAALVRPLADPQVGGVAGDQRYLPPEGVDAGTVVGERRYWNLDRALKAAESAGGHVISATGALYAVRRELVEPVPAGVTDDFTTSTGVIAAGARLVFAADAVVWEPVAETARSEAGRKVRVMTRGLQAVVLRRRLLDPRRHGFYAFQLLHHKVLRRLMALPLLGLAAAGPRCWRRGGWYRAATVAQGALYLPAAVGLAAPRSRLGRSRPCGLAAYFCLVNGAGLVAAINVARGRRIDRWEPDRVDPDGPPRAEREAAA